MVIAEVCMRCPFFRRGTWHWLMCGCWLLVLVGCNARPSSVSGTVTLDGNPLNDGLVTFHPEAGGPLAYGRIQPGGTYQLQTGSGRGLLSGEYSITVAANGPIPAPTKSNPEPIARLITPQRYSNRDHTPLKHSVAPGANVVDLPLVSR